MTVDIEELRRLEAAATAGRWLANGTRDPEYRCLDTQHEGGLCHTLGIDAPTADAEFIAAARNALPELIDSIATWERAAKYWNDNYELALANWNLMIDERNAAQERVAELEAERDKLLTHERCHAAGIDANAKELAAMDAAEIARLRARVAELETGRSELVNARFVETIRQSRNDERDSVVQYMERLEERGVWAHSSSIKAGDHDKTKKPEQR